MVMKPELMISLPNVEVNQYMPGGEASRQLSG
jgi:hypothetical protein